jgi:c-di-GMP-binding flagellar brake protein YcgR
VRSTTKLGAKPINCMLSNLSVTGARVDSPVPLPRGEELINVQFSLVLAGAIQETQVNTIATVRNVTVAKSAAGGVEIYTYGVQFVDLDPVDAALLQNMVYEALLADRTKIV